MDSTTRKEDRYRKKEGFVCNKAARAREGRRRKRSRREARKEDEQNELSLIDCLRRMHSRLDGSIVS